MPAKRAAARKRKLGLLEKADRRLAYLKETADTRKAGRAVKVEVQHTATKLKKAGKRLRKMEAKLGHLEGLLLQRTPQYKELSRRVKAASAKVAALESQGEHFAAKLEGIEKKLAAFRRKYYG